MAWTAPMTAVANTAFTAAQFNTHVRDNLLETGPAKATSGVTTGSHFVKSATNQISARTTSIASVLTSQSTSSTSYTNLATTGPTVTVTTGARALVFLTSYVDNNSGNSSYASIAVSGATTISADDDKAIRNRGSSEVIQATTAYMWTTLTPGSNTFQAKYRVAGGTGTYANRHLIVFPF